MHTCLPIKHSLRAPWLLFLSSFLGFCLPSGLLAQEAQAPEGLKPAEVITSSFQAILPAQAPTKIPFTVYQIKVGPTQSSLVIDLTGEGGDADLLLVADEPMQQGGDTLFASVGPTSAERIELRRNTVPTLRDTDYFLYVLHSEEEGGNLSLKIDLNLPADEGLKKLPKFPEGVISHELDQDKAWLCTFTQTAQVNLAMPAGSAPGVSLVRIQIPEGMKALDVNLWGNLSDIDLLLTSPKVDGEESLTFNSQGELSTEQISIGSVGSDELLPAGDWILSLERRDQARAEPLLLRVDMR